MSRTCPSEARRASDEPAAVRGRTSSGFTLLELIVALAIAGLVLSAAFTAVVSQSNQATLQAQSADVDDVLRGATTLLTAELRSVQPIRGDLDSLSVDGFSVRSFRGAGTACVVAGHTYGIRGSSGTFSPPEIDSVFVFDLTSSTWKVRAVSSVSSTAPSPEVSACHWSGATAPEIFIQAVAADPADSLGIQAGSPVVAFRWVRYEAVQNAGEWWLSRGLPGAGTSELVTGPLLAPSAGGIAFQYLDATGTQTLDPTLVSTVDVRLVAESAREVRRAGGVAPVRDSIRVLARAGLR